MKIPTIKLSQKFADKAISTLAGVVAGGGMATSIVLGSQTENYAFYLLSTPAFVASIYLASKQTQNFNLRYYLCGALAAMAMAVAKVEYDIYQNHESSQINPQPQIQNLTIS